MQPIAEFQNREWYFCWFTPGSAVKSDGEVGGPFPGANSPSCNPSQVFVPMGPFPDSLFHHFLVVLSLLNRRLAFPGRVLRSPIINLLEGPCPWLLKALFLSLRYTKHSFKSKFRFESISLSHWF